VARIVPRCSRAPSCGPHSDPCSPYPVASRPLHFPPCHWVPTPALWWGRHGRAAGGLLLPCGSSSAVLLGGVLCLILLLFLLLLVVRCVLACCLVLVRCGLSACRLGRSRSLPGAVGSGRSWRSVVVAGWRSSWRQRTWLR
jgi:hypothetical protein